ncbi:MAG: alanine racemase [candidate division Zixibacteria bacterium]|nr:alanine racemase [candidate division Zixibacteria bacterium]
MKQAGYLNWIELSRSALAHNIGSLRGLAGKRLLAISVKANGYGHGLGEIVKLLTAEPAADYITVHTLDEALAAREAGWERRIMVLGPLPPDGLEQVVKQGLEPMIFERRTLANLGKLLHKSGGKIRTHLKLETGTNRQGITAKELPAFARVYHRYAGLGRPYGAAMHFANIEDTTSHEYAEYQLENFRHLRREMARLKIKPVICHTACSAALILFDRTRFQLVRPGIAVYGHWPSKETYLSYRLQGGGDDLFHPVLGWKTKVTQIKRVARDSFVGYGCTYRTTSATRLAVLPVGYADGYDRGLSNRAHVLINGRRAPVRGRICMNLMMVDISDIKGVRVGSQATLIGRSGKETLTAEQLADWAGTINYELLARLSPLIPKLTVP